MRSTCTPPEPFADAAAYDPWNAKPAPRLPLRREEPSAVCSRDYFTVSVTGADQSPAPASLFLVWTMSKTSESLENTAVSKREEVLESRRRDALDRKRHVVERQRHVLGWKRDVVDWNRACLDCSSRCFPRAPTRADANRDAAARKRPSFDSKPAMVRSAARVARSRPRLSQSEPRLVPSKTSRAGSKPCLVGEQTGRFRRNARLIRPTQLLFRAAPRPFRSDRDMVASGPSTLQSVPDGGRRTPRILRRKK